MTSTLTTAWLPVTHSPRHPLPDLLFPEPRRRSPMTESTHPDILALEAVTATLLNPPTTTITKDVTRREGGHIAQVVERHAPFDASAVLQRGAEMVAQLNRETLSAPDAIRYGLAYDRFLGAAAPHASPESADAMLAAGQRMRDAAVRLARQPGNHA